MPKVDTWTGAEARLLRKVGLRLSVRNFAGSNTGTSEAGVRLDHDVDDFCSTVDLSRKEMAEHGGPGLDLRGLAATEFAMPIPATD